jgi:hypothetical protein
MTANHELLPDAWIHAAQHGHLPATPSTSSRARNDDPVAPPLRGMAK